MLAHSSPLSRRHLLRLSRLLGLTAVLHAVPPTRAAGTSSAGTGEIDVDAYPSVWAALDAARRAGGGVLRFGARQYPGLDLVDLQGITLAGAGPGRTVFRHADPAVTTIALARAPRCTLRDLTIAGPSAGTAVALYGLQSPGLTLTNVEVTGGAFAAVMLDRCPDGAATAVTIHDGQGNGLWLFQGSSRWMVRDLVVERMTGAGLCLDAGSTIPQAPEAIDGCVITQVTLRDTATGPDAPAALALQGARRTIVGSATIEGTGAGRPAVSLEEDQNAALPAVGATSGNSFGDLTVRRISGYALYLAGAQRTTIRTLRAADVMQAAAQAPRSGQSDPIPAVSFAPGAGGRNGTLPPDHACAENLIDVLELEQPGGAPLTHAVWFGGPAALIRGNRINLVRVGAALAGLTLAGGLALVEDGGATSGVATSADDSANVVGS